MKKLNLKITLILFVLVVTLSMVAPMVVYASSPLVVTNPTTTTTTTTQSTTSLTATPTPTPTATPTPTPTNTSTYQNSNSNLPKTGDAEDIAIMLFIVVCAVVSVFAYRKYKKFNV